MGPVARIAGYEILAPLGAGGMGEVYRARDEYLDREVAIKMLPAERQHDRGAIERFFREARAASALNHPHIVTIHAAGEVDAGHYIVMELVRGRTLRALIGAGLADDRLRDLGSQIARALAVAHEAGIVHRDRKTSWCATTATSRSWTSAWRGWSRGSIVTTTTPAP
jgi:serine/threonine protein kinase